MDFNLLIKGIRIGDLVAHNMVELTDDTETKGLLHILHLRDRQLQELAEQNGELKYKNKLLRKKLGYQNDNLAAEDE